VLSSIVSAIATETSSKSNFVDIDVKPWHWVALLVFFAALLLADLLIVHKSAHEVGTKEAAIESAVWISIGLAFGLVVWFLFSGQAAGEYYSAYLIEKSLSIDNVFVWALLLSYFKVPRAYQHRVLYWGVFGALVLRAIFIFAGVAIIDRFSFVLYIFGAFLLYTAGKLLFTSDEDEADPSEGFFFRLIQKFVPTTKELDGQKLFTLVNGKKMATPLFAVLLLVEATDVVFAVDSVPAVLALSREQFLIFSSNAFAILGLRALYFLLADMHSKFQYLQQGLAIILAFVGIKMLIAEWYHLPIEISLGFIAVVLTAAIVLSLQKSKRDEARMAS
jgi:tellurite resistance protein TerC